MGTKRQISPLGSLPSQFHNRSLDLGLGEGNQCFNLIEQATISHFGYSAAQDSQFQAYRFRIRYLIRTHRSNSRRVKPIWSDLFLCRENMNAKVTAPRRAPGRTVEKVKSLT
ncbi:hypothetical protein J1C56_17005 [Aminobacter anthyllidis]|uniref:Uncharacterized protein n=1 Tax=Aminobacter anthyllidis TaxID=1035067 RepID=A0A9X1D5L0_9HYPH|nr:hypothetical protein [Aminobacter anthyllidis]MBT1157292.1 hypothetical protein [Aminobacter anthyllidis]